MSSADAAPRTTHTDPAAGRWKKLVVVTLWVLVVAGYWIWSTTSGSGPRQTAVDLVDFLRGSAWGPVILIGTYLVRPLLLFSAALLTVAAGFLFGPIGGLVVVIVAANASAMVAYGVGRWFAIGVASLDPGGERLGRYLERMRSRSFETTLVLRLLFVPYDVVSYAAGIWRINPLGFLAGTALGSLPGTLAFVLFGASIEEFDGGVPSLDLPTVAISVGALLVSLAIARLIRRRETAD